MILPPRPSSAAAAASGAKYKKGKIPKALREALWLKFCGKSFEVKCHTTWCQNQITAYDFQAGHNVPECRGGPTTLDNLIPICSRCNLSMGSQYTFQEWCALKGQADTTIAAPQHTSWFQRIFCCTASDVQSQVAPYEVLPGGPVIGAQPPAITSAPAATTPRAAKRSPKATAADNAAAKAATKRQPRT